MKRTAWLAAPVSAFVLLALGAILDQPTEAQDLADEAHAAVTQAQVIAARDDLARRICTAELGPGTRVLWTVDGDLVCRPAPIVAKGGAL